MLFSNSFLNPAGSLSVTLSGSTDPAPCNFLTNLERLHLKIIKILLFRCCLGKTSGNTDANTNLLLTERVGRTGEYWPEVVTVRTERSEVRTKTTKGQYSPARSEQARLVSSLLYGTLFLIVKCTSGGLHLKNARLLHPSLKFWKNFNLFSFCWKFQ